MESAIRPEEEVEVIEVEQEVNSQVKDDLTQIRGVGPTLAKKLNAVGIYTFVDLVSTRTDKLKEVVGSRAQSIKTESDKFLDVAKVS